jgi:hypothetical protein
MNNRGTEICGSYSCSARCILHAGFLLGLLSSLKMEAIFSFETSVDFIMEYKAFCIAEDRILYLIISLKKSYI